MMDAKEFMQQYQEHDLMAKRCMAEYKAETEMIRCIRQIPSIRDYTREIDAVAQKAEEWKDHAEIAIRKRDEVLCMINSVPGIERDILYARHVDGLKCEDVADKYCYSLPGMWKVYYRGIAIIQSILDEGKGCSKGYSEK